MENENQLWKTYHFKNGKDYELTIANSKGVLVFRDSVFSAPFDDKEGLERRTKTTNKRSKCSLKPLLEKWWDIFAPDELKNNYKISIPHIYNIFPDWLLPEELKGKYQQWEIYKDWRNRLFGDHQCLETTSARTKTKHSDRSYDVLITDGRGNLYCCPVDLKAGVVPCLIPIKRKEK